MTKDYVLSVCWLDGAPFQRLRVCAEDVLDAHSECWQKLPENRLSLVDTFEVVSIHACQHEKGRVV